MGRWADTITLLKPASKWQDDEGAWHEGEREEREVFCDPGIIGSMTMAQLRSSEVRITSGENTPNVGMTRMDVVSIKQIDYDDEDQAIYRGKEMDVIAVTSEGENYKMILRRRLGND